MNLLRRIGSATTDVVIRCRRVAAVVDVMYRCRLAPPVEYVRLLAVYVWKGERE